MEAVEPKKNSWIELAVMALAVAALVYYVPMEKLIAALAAAFGLGFVIFWHELGHFLAAKWAGVKVLRFSIGFGLPGVPPIVSYRKGMGLSLLKTRNKEYEALVRAAQEGRPAPGLDKIGETEYVLGVLPLGGYVGMLGEDPGEGEERPTDPRAFINKPVGARMVILSAGVAMNILLGVACYTVLYLHGTIVGAARVGIVVAGSPAYRSGLRAGDEIVAIDGRGGIDWEDVMSAGAFSGTDQVVHFDVKRPGAAEPIRIDLRPERKEYDDSPKIGVGPSETLTLYGKEPFVAPPGMKGKPVGEFRGDDVVTAIGPEGGTPEPVSTPEELDRLLTRFADKPVVVVVRRAPKPDPKSSASESAEKPTAVEARITVPPTSILGFGARMAIEPISAIRPGSIAEKAGFLVGDTILKVDGESFDPLRLPGFCFDHAGRPVRFEIGRKGSDGRVASTTITATPDDSPPRSDGFASHEPLDVPGLGLAYAVAPRVVAVEPGSPAAKAGWKPGEVIASMTITTPAPLKDGKPSGKPKEQTVELDPKYPLWQVVFAQIQQVPTSPIKFQMAGSKATTTLTPEPVAGWYSGERGLQFIRLIRPLPPMALGASIAKGGRKTWEKVLSMYAMLRGLATRRLSPNGFGGIIPIADIAYQSAMSGFNDLVPFLAFLSINLAVLNFLPIPPLDGGQLLFLLVEKVRGRPMHEGAENFLKLAGVGFVLLLFVVVTFKDIMKYFVQ